MTTNKLLFTSLLSAGLTFSLINYANSAEPDTRDVVHDVRGNVVKNTFGNCVRTGWMSQGDECGAQVAEVQIQRSKQNPVPDEERTVYFEFNKTKLLESEQKKLSSLANTLKAMKDISGVSIAGYADRIGTAEYNEKLSKNRVEVVEEYLRANGYLNTTIAKTRWLGESEPVTECSEGLGRGALVSCLQKDRRVTVEIQYKGDALGETTIN